MQKLPSPWTIILTGWPGFMFATAVAALIPSLQLLTAPILCRAPYSHGVVQVHDDSYGTTSGYSVFLRCANAQHREHGTSIFAVVGLLWLFGWVAALPIRGVYYWTKFAITRGVDAYWRRRLPPPPARPRPVAMPQACWDPRRWPGSAGLAPAPAPRSRPVFAPGRPDPID